MEKYWEWICSVPGIFQAHKDILLKCFQNPEEVYRASEKELEFVKERGCPWISKIQKFRMQISPEGIIERDRSRGVGFVSAESDDFPKRLTNIRSRPYGIFYRGELPEEERRAVAIVGARMCTREGKEQAEILAGKIAQNGGIVISGAAYGIDGAAQMSALEYEGKSYALLGCGADICYPKSNQRLFDRLLQQGGLISEYPCGTMPQPHFFPARNRLISGLSDVVVIIEARKRSGSIITADYAAEQGRSVMVFPGRPDDDLKQGCNELISQGAGIILSVESFVEMIFPEIIRQNTELSEKFSLAPSEKLVYSSVDLHSKSLWELEECTALSLAELSMALTGLEMKGLIKETERYYYRRI